MRTVISLFNGMNTLRQAMENIGIKPDIYYSSEIKEYAIELTQHHFPDTIQLGDIRNWREWDIDWSLVDFIGSGSPCQDLSVAGKRLGLSGDRSSLFFVFVSILEHARKFNPDVLFLQENVGSAKIIDVGVMSRALGVYPERINSSLVTAQLRDRLYWSNIKTKEFGMFGDLLTDIPQPEDRKIMFKDILEHGTVVRDKCEAITEREYKNFYKDMVKFEQLIHRKKELGFNVPLHAINDDGTFRNLTKVEFCRLQGFPDDYCDILSRGKAVSLLVDGWTLPIIEHILKQIKW